MRVFQVRHLSQDDTVHLIRGSGDTIELLLEGVGVTAEASSSSSSTGSAGPNGTAIGPAGLETDVQHGEEGDGYIDTGPDVGGAISEDATWDQDYVRDRKATKRLPGDVKASSFKSWQKYHDAKEGAGDGDADTSGGILKSGAQLRRKDSSTRIAEWRQDLQQERKQKKAAFALPGDGDGDGDGESTRHGRRRSSRRRVSTTLDDGSTKSRTEEYEQSAETLSVMKTLERRLSSRISQSEMYSRRLLFPDQEVTDVFELEPTDRSVDPVWHGMSDEKKLGIRKELNELKTEMEVHEESKGNMRWHEDGPVYEGYAERVGERVRVDGYDCDGTLQFFGPHKSQPGSRCGVELDEPIGKNSGKVKGHRYFPCAKKCGLLCVPKKVHFLSDGPAAANEAPPDPNAAPKVKSRPTSRADDLSDEQDNNAVLLLPTPHTAAAKALSHQRCIVKHSFGQTHEDELDLETGGVVTLISAPEGGWWQGSTADGREGWFPANHVEIVRNEDSSGRRRSMSSDVRPRSFFSLYSEVSDDDVPEDEPEGADGFGDDEEPPIAIALHKYVAANTDELTFETGDTIELLQTPAGGWWQGRMFGDEGWFPSNYVETGTEGRSPVAPAGGKGALDLSDSATKFGWNAYTAIADFEPRHGDEVRMKKGDSVYVMQEIDGGWWEVSCNGTSGWIPRGMLSETPAEGTDSGDSA